MLVGFTLYLNETLNSKVAKIIDILQVSVTIEIDQPACGLLYFNVAYVVFNWA